MAGKFCSGLLIKVSTKVIELFVYMAYLEERRITMMMLLKRQGFLGICKICMIQ